MHGRMCPGGGVGFVRDNELAGVTAPLPNDGRAHHEGQVADVPRVGVALKIHPLSRFKVHDLDLLSFWLLVPHCNRAFPVLKKKGQHFGEMGEKGIL